MKKFENPEIKIEVLNVLDVITASCTDDCPSFNCTGDLGLG